MYLYYLYYSKDANSIKNAKNANSTINATYANSTLYTAYTWYTKNTQYTINANKCAFCMIYRGAAAQLNGTI